MVGRCVLCVATTMALLGVAGGSAPVAFGSGNQVPFQATLNEQFTPVPCGATQLCATSTGSGTASHLGQVTVSFFGTVDFSQANPTTGCAPDTATGTLTRANGDQVFITSVGQFCPTSATAGTDSGTYQITGGTGHFAGATGSGTYASTVSFATGTATDVLQGTISEP